MRTNGYYVQELLAGYMSHGIKETHGGDVAAYCNARRQAQDAVRATALLGVPAASEGGSDPGPVARPMQAWAAMAAPGAVVALLHAVLGDLGAGGTSRLSLTLVPCASPRKNPK